MLITEEKYIIPRPYLQVCEQALRHGPLDILSHKAEIREYYDYSYPEKIQDFFLKNQTHPN